MNKTNSAGEDTKRLARQVVDEWRFEDLGADQTIRFMNTEPLVDRIAALVDTARQDFCDHCSGDLNSTKHILCEKCYRRFDSDEHDRAVAHLSEEEKTLYPRHPNDPRSVYRSPTSNSR